MLRRQGVITVARAYLFPSSLCFLRERTAKCTAADLVKSEVKRSSLRPHHPPCPVVWSATPSPETALPAANGFGKVPPPRVATLGVAASAGAAPAYNSYWWMLAEQETNEQFLVDARLLAEQG
jgi:hypothetical protein